MLMRGADDGEQERQEGGDHGGEDETGVRTSSSGADSSRSARHRGGVSLTHRTGRASAARDLGERDGIDRLREMDRDEERKQVDLTCGQRSTHAI